MSLFTNLILLKKNCLYDNDKVQNIFQESDL